MRIRVLNTRDRRVIADAARLQRTMQRALDTAHRSALDASRVVLDSGVVRRASSVMRQCAVNVVLIGNRRMRELNRRYLKRDRPTDVLSFPLGVEEPGGKELLLGEVYVSRDQARIQARENRVSYHSEVKRLVLHGVLHLLGLTHKQMEGWYEQAL